MKKTKSRQQLVQNIVRLVAIIAAVVMITAGISALILNQTESAQRHRINRERSASQQEIVRHLEFNGLDDDAKEMMQTHARTYTDYSNFVVVDNAFNVLYSTSQGYLDGSGNFFGLLYEEEFNQYGVVCAQDGSILSLHYLNSDDIGALQQLTNSSKVKPKRVIASEEFDDAAPVQGGTTYAQDRAAVYLTESIGGISYNNQMYFAPMTSKGMYLYFLYDNDTPKWDGNTRSETNIYGWLGGFGIFSFLVYWMALAAWVFIDAQKRDHHPALWGVLTLFTNFIGLIVYLVTRPEAIACKVCREPLEKHFSYCPYCGARNRAKCEVCGELITPGWSNCPYCGTPVPPEENAVAQIEAVAMEEKKEEGTQEA